MSSKAYRDSNREKRLEYNRKWRAENPGKRAAQDKRYADKHPTKMLEKAKRRYSRIRMATPTWLSADDRFEMRRLQILAKETDQHVDHIVPIAGKNVCGLNVPWNLRVIRKRDNLRKAYKL